jgi:hypothetical protein
MVPSPVECRLDAEAWLLDSHFRGCSCEQVGAIFLCLLHARVGRLPADHACLAQLLHLPREHFEARVWPVLATYFTEHDGALDSVILERERVRVANYHERQTIHGRRGAAKRWAMAKVRAAMPGEGLVTVRDNRPEAQRKLRRAPMAKAWPKYKYKRRSLNSTNQLIGRVESVENAAKASRRGSAKR